MTPDEKRILVELASTKGVSKSDIIRLAIRREYDELTATKKPKR